MMCMIDVKINLKLNIINLLSLINKLFFYN